MNRPTPSSRVALVVALAVAFVQPLALAQPNPLPLCPLPPGGTPPDNRDGYFVNFEEAPIHPLELTANRQELWAINLPDASVSVFNVSSADNPVQLAVVKVGLGPVSLRQRPVAPNGADEIWVACQSSNAVYIIDRISRQVVETLRLVAEPVDIVFNSSGSLAYVSLAATNQVVEIDAAARTELRRLEFGTDFPLTANFPDKRLIHAEEPRALHLVNDQQLLALSFKSGNGTTPFAPGFETVPIDNIWNYINLPGVEPPPDRDVLEFSLPNAAQCRDAAGNFVDCATTALWRMGTMNFDMVEEAGEIWVSTVDLNNDLVGEFQFPSGQIGRHLISHLPTQPPATPNPPPSEIDLNLQVDPMLLAQGYSCAMPNDMVVVPSGSQRFLYVACYETHNVAQVDITNPSAPLVVAQYSGLQGPPGVRNLGVRGLVANAVDNVLYAFSRDQRLQVYKIPGSQLSNVPVREVPIGFDITTPVIEEGRFHHINSLRSETGTQSCNTCHIDGDLDGVAWDLSDFTGDLTVANPQPREPKGTKVTMSFRGIEETAPFHWRGDRVDLVDFNPAFEGLLGGTQLNDREMLAFQSYVFSLSYPANPFQPLGRCLSTTALQGMDAFINKDAHDLLFEFNQPVQQLSCNECHLLGPGSGTVNQVVNDATAVLDEDATQLRGLWDKVSDPLTYPNLSAFPVLNQIPATGWGVSNTGFIDTTAEFVDLPVFNLLSVGERNDIKQLLRELDTGIAPAAAFAWTLNGVTAGSPNEPVTGTLQVQAALGHIDLIARGWIGIAGSPVRVGMLYNPQTQRFETSIPGQGPFTFSVLDTMAGAGNTVLTFLGTPVGMGYRLALDEEMDFLLDGAEAGNNATVGSADSDGDGYPDGYEVRLGSLPNQSTSIPPPESVAPTITRARVSWTNSSVAKVRWRTDEEAISRAIVFLAGTNTQVSFQEERQFKRQHVLVVRGLQPNQTYDIRIEAEDPANGTGPGNVGRRTLTNVSTAAHLFRSTHVAATTLVKLNDPAPGTPYDLQASFRIFDEANQPLTNTVVQLTFDQVEWVTGGGNHPSSPLTHTLNGTTDGAGWVRTTFPSLHNKGQGALAETYVSNVSVGNLLYFNPLDGQFGFWDQAELP